MFAAPVAAQEADEGNVYVSKVELWDETDHFGVKYYLSSTVNAMTCVVPYVVEQTNVNGGIGAPYVLQPMEQDVLIGQFNRADDSQGWSVNVAAKWRRGDC